MQKIYTERAHLMCPQMNFGIIIEVKDEYNEKKLIDSLDLIAKAHPFLRALLGNSTDGAFYYNIGEESKIEISFEKATVSDIYDEKIQADYERLTSKEWNLHQEGMLKVVSYKAGEHIVLLLVFHHLLTDGRGAIALAEELAACYVNGTKPQYAEENLIASKQDMPDNSNLPFISRVLVKWANRQWIKEKHKLEYSQYLELANDFNQKYKVSHGISILPNEEYKEIVEKCHKEQVSVNDYLIASMILKEKTNKVIIACDLRERLKCYNQGALGNYSTAFSVEYCGKSQEVWEVARRIQSEVDGKIRNPRDLYLVLQCYADLNGELLDAAFASARCGYGSKAARFIGSAFFGFANADGLSITNLGKFESDSIEIAAFIPPASPAIKKTLGVVTFNGKMVVATSER